MANPSVVRTQPASGTGTENAKPLEDQLGPASHFPFLHQAPQKILSHEYAPNF